MTLLAAAARVLAAALPAPSAEPEAIAYRLAFGAPVEVFGPAGTIARTRTRADGGCSVRARGRGTGPFRARVAGLLSAADSVPLRPAIDPRLVGPGLVGGRLRLVTAARPAGAGTLTATVWRNGRRAHSGPVGRTLELRTASAASFRIRLEVAPADGYLAHTRVLRGAVVQPSLGRGARGEDVLAFQQLEGLPRSGRVDGRTCRRLLAARIPRARYPGTHLEVSKGRQVLFAVVRGEVSLVVHVSTGATGNTPLGHRRAYRKVTGWDCVLWYPMYFLRGFAVHGYPEVPGSPASHGCVRVPMWLAPRLFRAHTYGGSVYIYP